LHIREVCAHLRTDALAGGEEKVRDVDLIFDRGFCYIFAILIGETKIADGMVNGIFAGNLLFPINGKQQLMVSAVFAGKNQKKRQKNYQSQAGGLPSKKINSLF
jgi:hypothetical protein